MLISDQRWTGVCSEVSSVPLESRSASKQRTLVSKRLGKKRYVIVAIIAAALIVVAFSVPQGAATIPLSVNYVVGERMVQYTTETILTQAFNATTGQLEPSLYPNGTSQFNSTDTADVVGFDGEIYTLNHTVNMDTGTDVSFHFISRKSE